MIKTTHIYPRAGVAFGEWDRSVVPPVWQAATQTYIGNGDTEDDVWDEVRSVTLGDYNNKVVVLETHQYALEAVREELHKGEYNPTNVFEFSYLDVEKKIYSPSGVKTITSRRFVHIGDTWQVDGIVEKAKDAALLVVYEPHEEAGELDCLNELHARCPHLDLVIVHCVSDKYGVVVDGDPENWEDEFPPLSDLEFEPPQVIVDDLLIKGNIHVVAGRFEAYKTMGLIELSDAILSERPAFDHFKVQQRYPILFLCADMSGELFDDYAAPFNLRGHGEDFRVKRPTGSSLHAIDSPVLQRAVSGRILILDTMLDFANIKEAFQSGEWITFMQKLRELMTVHGCIAVVMTAHATKTGAKSNTIDPSEYLKDS